MHVYIHLFIRKQLKNIDCRERERREVKEREAISEVLLASPSSHKGGVWLVRVFPESMPSLGQSSKLAREC